MKRLVVKDLELRNVENVKEYLVNEFNITEFPFSIEISGKLIKDKTPIKPNSGITCVLHDSLIPQIGIIGIAIIVWDKDIVKDTFVHVSTTITSEVLDYIERENNLHIERYISDNDNKSQEI